MEPLNWVLMRYLSTVSVLTAGDVGQVKEKQLRGVKKLTSLLLQMMQIH